MQAKLPDVNAAIVRHRSLAAEGFNTKNPELAIISISNINALLPAIEGKTYKVEVSTQKYWEARKETRTIQCRHCKAENPILDVEHYEIDLQGIEKILSKEKSRKMWNCGFCKKANYFSTDDITVTKKGEPYFFKVIPEPPVKQAGIKGRTTFERDFITWFSIAMPEIESQIGLYRMEYAAQEEGDMIEINSEDDPDVQEIKA